MSLQVSTLFDHLLFRFPAAFVFKFDDDYGRIGDEWVNVGCGLLSFQLLEVEHGFLILYPFVLVASNRLLGLAAVALAAKGRQGPRLAAITRSSIEICKRTNSRLSWVSFNPDCVTSGNPPHSTHHNRLKPSLSLSADKLRVKILDRQKST